MFHPVLLKQIIVKYFILHGILLIKITQKTSYVTIQYATSQLFKLTKFSTSYMGNVKIRFIQIGSTGSSTLLELIAKTFTEENLVIQAYVIPIGWEQVSIDTDFYTNTFHSSTLFRKIDCIQYIMKHNIFISLDFYLYHSKFIMFIYVNLFNYVCVLYIYYVVLCFIRLYRNKWLFNILYYMLCCNVLPRYNSLLRQSRIKCVFGVNVQFVF